MRWGGTSLKRRERKGWQEEGKGEDERVKLKLINVPTSIQSTGVQERLAGTPGALCELETCWRWRCMCPSGVPFAGDCHFPLAVFGGE